MGLSVDAEQRLRGSAQLSRDPVVEGAKVADAPKAVPTFMDTLSKAAGKAFHGGLSGFVAGALQVMAFMWLRTIMNKQYYVGGSMIDTAKALWEEGGILRFYQGFGFAVFEAPAARFGDTFANVGVMALFAGTGVPALVTTIFVSCMSAMWRIVITPIDTFKTTMQVQGDSALTLLFEKVKTNGILMLWTGAAANFVANVAGNYPWWATFNTIDSLWLEPKDPAWIIIRAGLMGMIASCVSDCISNVFRVLKTVCQASPDANMTYTDALKSVIKTDGVIGLFTRGLGTRVFTNVLQGSFFTIAWKLIQKNMA